MSSEAETVEAKLDLIVNVALMTIMTLMRLIESKGLEALGDEEIAQFDKVRASVLEATEALETWQASTAATDTNVDLSSIEGKLQMLRTKLDEWPLPSPDEPS